MTRRTTAAAFATCLSTLASTVLLVACDMDAEWPAASQAPIASLLPATVAAEARDPSVPDAQAALRDLADERDMLPPSI